MERWKTIELPPADREKLAKYKPDNTSWGKYLVSLLNYREGARSDYDDKIIREGK
jgi:hypothetical protein